MQDEYPIDQADLKIPTLGMDAVERVAWRPIRSFVRRESRITTRQQQALVTQQQWFLAPGTPAWKAWLDPAAVLKLEIGFGQGENLLQQAQSEPHTRFLGIEVYRPGIGALFYQLAQWHLENVRVCCGDASELLGVLPDEGLERVWVLFPDPWPKKRHHKRRLLQPAFFDALHPKMKMNGILHIATDWADYAESILDHLMQADGWRNQAGSGYAPRPPERALTRFERRGQRLGHGVWDIIFERIST